MHDEFSVRLLQTPALTALRSSSYGLSEGVRQFKRLSGWHGRASEASSPVAVRQTTGDIANSPSPVPPRLMASRTGPSACSGIAQQTTVEVNAKRIEERILTLGRIGSNPEGGVSRVAFSEADVRGREYLSGLMRSAGLEVSIDAAGNLLGRRNGQDSSPPPVLFADPGMGITVGRAVQVPQKMAGEHRVGIVMARPDDGFGAVFFLNLGQFVGDDSERLVPGNALELAAPLGSGAGGLYPSELCGRRWL